MADSVTYAKLQTLAARAAGLDQANLETDETNAILDACNEAVEEVADARPWPRLIIPYRFTTQAPYATGTLAATNGDETITLTGGSFPTWIEGAEIVFDNSVYIINTRTDATHSELLTAFAGTTASGLAYTIRQTWVWLPADFQKFARESKIVYAGATGYAPLQLIGVGQIDELRSYGNSGSYPTHAAIGGADSSGSNLGRLRLELYPSPAGAYGFLTRYRRRLAAMSSGSDLPDLPYELHRAVKDYTQIIVKKRFSRPVDQALIAEGERAIARAAEILLPTMENNAAPLCSVNSRRYANYPEGRNCDLSPDYT